MTLTARLASDATLDCAFGWLCRRRQRWPDAADVWSFRRDWPAEKARLQRELDARLEATGLFTVRFMDDILVLAPTRWKLRRAVRIVNETLAGLGLEKHPDKTFIGRAAKGFDFLGDRVSPEGLSVAKQTRERFAERAARLQERERTGGASPGALGQYVRRWQQWARAGLDGLVATGWGGPGDPAAAGFA